MNRTLWVLLILGGYSLAAQPSDDESSGEQSAEQETSSVEDIETILTQPLGQEEYVESERCLSRYLFNSVDIIDDRHVLFRGSRGRAWLNTLRRRCIGLRRHDIPTFEYRAANQLCSLDDFVGVSHGLGGFNRTSASCVLGEFQPVTEEQVALIKATVESRKSRRGKRKRDPGATPAEVVDDAPAESQPSDAG